MATGEQSEQSAGGILDQMANIAEAIEGIQKEFLKSLNYTDMSTMCHNIIFKCGFQQQITYLEDNDLLVD